MLSKLPVPLCAVLHLWFAKQDSLSACLHIFAHKSSLSADCSPRWAAASLNQIRAGLTLEGSKTCHPHNVSVWLEDYWGLVVFKKQKTQEVFLFTSPLTA